MEYIESLLRRHLETATAPVENCTVKTEAKAKMFFVEQHKTCALRLRPVKMCFSHRVHALYKMGSK